MTSRKAIQGLLWATITINAYIVAGLLKHLAPAYAALAHLQLPFGADWKWLVVMAIPPTLFLASLGLAFRVAWARHVYLVILGVFAALYFFDVVALAVSKVYLLGRDGFTQLSDIYPPVLIALKWPIWWLTVFLVLMKSPVRVLFRT